MGCIEKKAYRDGPTFFYDPEDEQHCYGRIIGGVGWRGKRPGFIVVVGEDVEPDKNLNAFHWWVLKEYESDDTLKLLKKALEFRDFESAKLWVGDTKNSLEMSFLEKVNEPIPYDMQFWVEWAPNSDDPKAFDFCLTSIERALNPHKLLHFGESKIPEYLQEISSENQSSFGVLDYPAITALGNAIGYMREYKLDPYENTNYTDDEERNQNFNYLTGEME